MDNLLPENEYYTFESRKYSNPQVDLDRSNAFIDNLRNVQQANNQIINQQTRDLGTQVPSNLGGLIGGEGYWTSRYQTPQINSMVNDLRATAQAKALNEVLANQEAMWKKRYDDAYRSYQKRSWDRSGGGGGEKKGDVETPEGGGQTGLTPGQDENEYYTYTTPYNVSYTANDSRGTQRNSRVEVTRDNSGDVLSISIDGVKSYGRDAKAKYRQIFGNTRKR